MDSISIDNKIISRKNPTFIIAEVGVNHNGQLSLAKELIHAASEAGADCVKFQTFSADRVVTALAPKATYQLKVTDPKESQLEMLKKLELAESDFSELFLEANRIGISILSTPYSEIDADMLDRLGVSAFKVASSQLVEPLLLRHIAHKNRPIILSTGMATLAEVSEAVSILRSACNDQIVVLQCTTNYPSSIQDANIKAMVSMRNALGILTGYSDHVPQNYACYAAVSLGATVIEKHFTLDRTMDGPDHGCSLNPQEFAELVSGIRAIEASLGSSVKEPTASEKENILGMRRSLVARNDIAVGDIFTSENLTCKRPASGLAPRLADTLIGRRANKTILKDEFISFDSIEWKT